MGCPRNPWVTAHGGCKAILKSKKAGPLNRLFLCLHAMPQRVHRTCRKGKAYLAAAAMNSTAARRSASDAWAAPPRGGIAPLPLATLLYSASMPAGRRADQAALSPNLGAPATPAAWHTWQACLYRASPAPAAAAAATGAAAAGAASAAGAAAATGVGGGGGSGF